VNAGAQVNWVTETGTSALSEAARFGRLEAVESLLGLGAYLNVNSDGVADPISVGIEAGHRQVVKRLLPLVPDPSLYLEFASQEGDEQMVKLIRNQIRKQANAIRRNSVEAVPDSQAFPNKDSDIARKTGIDLVNSKDIGAKLDKPEDIVCRPRLDDF